MAYNPNMYMPQNYISNSWNMQMQPVNGLVSVTGIEGARAYQLPPNSSMPLFDQNDDIMYLKTTDAAGYPTIKTFSFTPMDDDSGPDMTQYVDRSEFDALLERVNEIAGSRRSKKESSDAK